MRKRKQRSDLYVRFQDECPAIGSGVRGVQILTVGPKWARIRATASQKSCRLKRVDWDRLARHAVGRA